MAAVYKSLSKANGRKDDAPAGGARKNKQRVLILSSRGVTFRHRHLINDIASMLPHGRKDSKFDSKSKSKLAELNELAELYNCNNVLFFEARKGKDLYAWMGKIPNGPTVKLHVQNLHTMEELHFTGNCLKGSRPILSFDSSFDAEPYLQVIKELFLHIYGVPQAARKSKPFIDHVLSFSFADGRIFVRNYQITEVEKDGKGDPDEDSSVPVSASKGKLGETDIKLIEIGPRHTLTPIVIQEGSFGGPIIYQNKQFVTPNQVRSDLKRAKASRHNTRAEQQGERIAKKSNLGLRTNGARRSTGTGLETRELFA